MKCFTYLSIILFLVSVEGFAQKSKRLTYIIANDKQYVVNYTDGWVNLREEPSINAPILCTIPQNTIVSGAFGDYENWLFVRIKSNGFIHKSRLLEIPQTIVKQKEAHDYNTDWEITRIIQIRDKENNRLFKIYFCEKDMTYGFVVNEKNEVFASVLCLGLGILDKYDTYKVKNYDFSDGSLPIRRYSFTTLDMKGYRSGHFSMDVQGKSILGARFLGIGAKEEDTIDLSLVDDVVFVPGEFDNR